MEDKTVLEKDTEKMAYNNKQSVMKGIEIAGFDYLRDVDERVSTMIYNYLMGKSDVLPTYEEVNALVESAGERNRSSKRRRYRDLSPPFGRVCSEGG